MLLLPDGRGLKVRSFSLAWPALSLKYSGKLVENYLPIFLNSLIFKKLYMIDNPL